MNDLLPYLYGFLSEQRRAVFDRITANRTRHLTLVLENIYHPHNVSAVFRTSECFGLQDVHLIAERYGTYDVSPRVVVGATKWLHVHQHATGQQAFEQLRASGYQLVATAPDAPISIDELDVTKKTALIFGAEKGGIEPSTLAQADQTVRVPMYGFTESLNISVSVALCVRSFVERMRKTHNHWHLSDEEIKELLLEWTRKSLKRADILERNFHQKQ